MVTAAERAREFLRVADEEYRHIECCPIIRSLLADNEMMLEALERIMVFNENRNNWTHKECMSAIEKVRGVT